MNKIKLYHYSNSDFKGYINPCFFGENSFSRNSQRISGIKRSYFYIDRQSREICLKGVKFLYIAEIEPSRLYDLRADRLNLAEQLRGKDIFKEAKQRGYIGLIGNNGFNCICLFKAVKIKNKIPLTKV
jgi:hypothetical protein